MASHSFWSMVSHSRNYSWTAGTAGGSGLPQKQAGRALIASLSASAASKVSSRSRRLSSRTSGVELGCMSWSDRAHCCAAFQRGPHTTAFPFCGHFDIGNLVNLVSLSIAVTILSTVSILSKQKDFLLTAL